MSASTIPVQPMGTASTDAPALSWPIFGHKWAVRLLHQNSRPPMGAEAKGGEPRHAYLFVGPASIGKTTLAKTFAQALLCTDNRLRPCGRCRACRLADGGNHPDMRFIRPLDRHGDPDRAGGLLRAEQASEIIHEANLRPLEGRYKIFLVQDVHTANDAFANKLLKTLEEPPDHVVLLLTALEKSNLLPTIVSRCQVVELRPVPADEIQKALINGWQVAPDRAALLARLANGRLGWAVRQLEDDAGAEWRHSQLAELQRLVAADRVERLDFSATLSAGRDNEQLFAMLALWTTWWRDVLMVQTGCQAQCSNIDHMAVIEQQAQELAPRMVVRFLHRLHYVEGLLHHTVNTRLALDVLVLRLPYVRLRGEAMSEAGMQAGTSIAPHTQS